MLYRFTFLLLFVFWLSMTYLLWRSEWIGHNQGGSSLPPAVVWKRILTAPDNSSLQIMHHGKKVGNCNWASNVGEDLVEQINGDGNSPGAPAKNVTSYRLALDGNVLWSDDAVSRLKFGMQLKLSTNHAWQDFDLRLNIRPTIWEFHSRAADQNLHFITEDKKSKTEQVFKFSDFRNPAALLQDVNGPAALGLLGALGSVPSAKNKDGGGLSLGLDWKARNDWVAIGHSSVKAYRLDATLLDHYRVFIIVSRVGEILKVELPDEWELVNDQLINL